MTLNLVKQAGSKTLVSVLTFWLIGSACAQDYEPIDLINEMSAEIASLDSFVITGEGYVDTSLVAGQVIEHSMDVTLQMKRPGAMRITNRDAESTKEIYFENGIFTVYNDALKFYAQTDIPGDVDAAARFAVDEIGIDAPMLDFVVNDVGKYLLEDSESIDYLGLSLFRQMTYHHIGIRAPEFDLQIWIPAEGPPLPGKLAISMKWEAGSPRSVLFFNWNTNPDIGAEAFSFVPPASATRIEFDLYSE